MKNFLKITMVLAALAIFSAPKNALAGPGFGTTVDDGNCAAPLDGGLSILLAAGVGYGVKKVKENRKKNQGVEEVTTEK